MRAIRFVDHLAVFVLYGPLHAERIEVIGRLFEYAGVDVEGDEPAMLVNVLTAFGQLPRRTQLHVGIVLRVVLVEAFAIPGGDEHVPRAEPGAPFFIHPGDVAELVEDDPVSLEVVALVQHVLVVKERRMFRHRHHCVRKLPVTLGAPSPVIARHGDSVRRRFPGLPGPHLDVFAHRPPHPGAVRAVGSARLHSEPGHDEVRVVGSQIQSVLRIVVVHPVHRCKPAVIDLTVVHAIAAPDALRPPEAQITRGSILLYRRQSLLPRVVRIDHHIITPTLSQIHTAQMREEDLNHPHAGLVVPHLHRP